MEKKEHIVTMLSLPVAQKDIYEGELMYEDEYIPLQIVEDASELTLPLVIIIRKSQDTLLFKALMELVAENNVKAFPHTFDDRLPGRIVSITLEEPTPYYLIDNSTCDAKVIKHMQYGDGEYVLTPATTNTYRHFLFENELWDVDTRIDVVKHHIKKGIFLVKEQL